MSFLPLFLQAGSAAGTTGAAGSAGTAAGAGIATFLPLILLVLIWYFLLLRPQNKKQKETQKMLDALKKGDKVVTVGGIHGTVSNVREDTVTLKVDDNCHIEFNRASIHQVLTPKPLVVEPKDEKKGKDVSPDASGKDKKDKEDE